MIKTIRTRFNPEQEKVLESILREVKHSCSTSGYVASGSEGTIFERSHGSGRITPTYHIGIYKNNKHIATITIVLDNNIRAWSEYHKLLDRPRFVKKIVHRLTR